MTYLPPGLNAEAFIRTAVNEAIFDDAPEGGALPDPDILGPLSSFLGVDHASLLRLAIDDAFDCQNEAQKAKFFERLGSWLSIESNGHLSNIFGSGELALDELREEDRPRLTRAEREAISLSLSEANDDGE